MAEELQEIEDAAIGVDGIGGIKYVINGRPVGRDDFNAVSLYRIANHLAMLQERFAPDGPPGAPTEDLGIFGGAP